MNYVTALMQIVDQLQIYHWQTKSFARHKALGKTYEGISDLVDDFVEISMGKHGRFVLDKGDRIELSNISDSNLEGFVEDTIAFLLDLNKQLDPATDSDLLNIRDDMLGQFNRLKYLLTLS